MASRSLETRILKRLKKENTDEFMRLLNAKEESGLQTLMGELVLASYYPDGDHLTYDGPCSVRCQACTS